MLCLLASLALLFYAGAVLAVFVLLSARRLARIGLSLTVVPARRTVDKKFARRDVGIVPQQRRRRRPAVAPGASDLLIVGFK